MPNYIVIEDFLAPKQELESDGYRLQRQFKKGEFIGGKPNGYARLKGEMVHVIKESAGFIIPAKSLKQIDKKYGDDGGEEAKKMNEQIVKIANRDLLKDAINASKSSMKGVVIGAFGGFAIALLKRQSLLWCGFIGGVSGGLIGYGVNKFLKDKVKSEEKVNQNLKL